MLEEREPPVVSLDGEFLGGGELYGILRWMELDWIEAEVEEVLGDLVVRIGCADTPTYRRVVKACSADLVFRYVQRCSRDEYIVELATPEELERSLRCAAKLAAELGPLLEHNLPIPEFDWCDPAFAEVNEPIGLSNDDVNGCFTTLGRCLTKLTPILEAMAETGNGLQLQCPETTFYREAISVWEQLGGTRDYFPFVKMVGGIARLPDFTRKQVNWARYYKPTGRKRGRPPKGTANFQEGE
jgi:hypothetical protein